ncbi:MAG: hypothetical protein EOO61_00520 [Hymenobacter sp.]|nr:MAG: hypothetical protein EOO61_00520 [Hymenobacter sp.]
MRHVIQDGQNSDVDGPSAGHERSSAEAVGMCCPAASCLPNRDKALEQEHLQTQLARGYGMCQFREVLISCWL